MMTFRRNFRFNRALNKILESESPHMKITNKTTRPIQRTSHRKIPINTSGQGFPRTQKISFRGRKQSL